MYITFAKRFLFSLLFLIPRLFQHLHGCRNTYSQRRALDRESPLWFVDTLFKEPQFLVYYFSSRYVDVAQMGTVSICEMLHRTNLIAIVGGGQRPKFADNTILIYDDAVKEFVLEYTFTQPVVAVRLKRDRYIRTHT